eukprot:9504606-Karenia_brevis.AAC.1
MLQARKDQCAAKMGPGKVLSCQKAIATQLQKTYEQLEQTRKIKTTKKQESELHLSSLRSALASQEEAYKTELEKLDHTEQMYQSAIEELRKQLSDLNSADQSSAPAPGTPSTA